MRLPVTPKGQHSANRWQSKTFLLSLRFFICVFAAGITLFASIDKQNELTELRLAIPALAKNVKSLQEVNIHLKYEIERFESPIHLMELMRKPEFSHLKYPYLNDVVILQKKDSIKASAGDK